MPSQFFRRSRAVLTGLALCGAATAAVLPATSGAASAAQVPSTSATATEYYYTFSAESDGLYLDVQGGSTAKGALVLQWLPTGTASEEWGTGPGWHIRNENSGMCLTTDGVAGDQLYQWPCRRSLAWYQNWTVLYYSNGVDEIINRHFDLYVDVYQDNTTLGGPIDAWPNNGGYPNQLFAWG
jgi:hypothetical protein